MQEGDQHLQLFLCIICTIPQGGFQRRAQTPKSTCMVEETILGNTPMAIGGAYKTARAGRILKGHNPLGSHDVRARVAEKTNRDGSMDGDRTACDNRTFKGETGAVKRLTA